MTFDIVLTIFLVLLNGFFVAAEFAIVKVRSSQISLQAGTASKKAAQAVINNLDGFLAATQLGITLASLGLGWVGEDVVSKLILQLIAIECGRRFVAVYDRRYERLKLRLPLADGFAASPIGHMAFWPARLT